MKSLTTAEFRRRLADVVVEVARTKKPIAITRYRTRLVALIPIEMLTAAEPAVRPRAKTRPVQR